jgi:hypothetical protein
MASGYEKSPEYGAPPVKPGKLVLGGIAAFAVCAAILFIRHKLGLL